MVAGAERPRPRAHRPRSTVDAAAIVLVILIAIAAVPAAGQTRSPTGAPGPAYWQQRVDYRVDARLDPERHHLAGTAWITYRNNSPDTLRTLHWHLYQNIFRSDSPAADRTEIVGRAMTATRGITVHEVSSGERELVRLVRGTLMETPLGAPLLPGDTLALRVGWELDVPTIASLRTGSAGEDFGMAQWYPQVAVYDDVHGWNTSPYRGQGEFYTEFGDWDVRLTLPTRFLVAATGTLQNAEEVLSAPQRARLAGVTRGRVTPIVSESDTGGVGHGGAARHWHFAARDVRDFAWAASPRFVWNATRTAATARHPDGILIHSLFAPDERSFYEQSADVARDAIERFDRRFGPYIYPQATTVSGPVEGMEYPMLVFEGVASRVINMPPQVTVHELAHEWFPMMVGSNETRHAFMDEGFATYMTSVALAERYAGAALWSERLPRFARGLLGRGDERRFNLALALISAGRNGDTPLMTHADSTPALQLATNAYNKTSVVLFMLRDVIGEPAFSRAMLAYYDRWLLKHPYAPDFFNTVEDVAGRDLDWFWDEWFYQTWTLDVAVDEVTQTSPGGARPTSAAVTLRNGGRAVMPLTLRLTLDDGSTRDVRVPETVWRGGPRHTVRVDSLTARVRSVEVDPGLVLLDTDRGNNVWPRGAPPVAGMFFGVTIVELIAMLAVAVILVVAARATAAYGGLEAAGFRPVRLGSRRVIVWSVERGLRLGWRRKPRLFGSTTLGAPPAVGTAHDLRRRTARAWASGPAAAVVLAAAAGTVCLALELAYRRGLRQESSFRLDSLLFLVGVVALLGFVLSLVPRPTRGFFAPHPWLRLLLGQGLWAVRWSAAQALVAASHGGVRPRDWSAQLVAWATEPADGTRGEAGGALLAYYHSLDRGDPETAAHWLERARAGTASWWSRWARRTVLAETAFFAALYRHDPATALTALAGARRGRWVEPRVWTRARAAERLSAGDAASALELVARGQAELSRTAVRAGAGIAAMEEDLLARITEASRADAESGAGAPVADTAAADAAAADAAVGEPRGAPASGPEPKPGGTSD
jgi:hypothetical protein